MKCKHCGMEVNKGLKYCNNCGKSVENTDSNIKNPFQKIPKRYLYIGAGVVLSLAALLLILANRTTTIRLDKYIQADIEEYDGYGTADLYIDWEKIEAKYGDKISLVKGTSASASAQFAGLFSSEVDELPLEILKDSVEIKVDKTSGLSNGDTITCTIRIDDEYEAYVDCRMKADREVEYTVSGLSKYVAEIADINESGMKLLKQQAEDTYEGLRSAWNTDEITYKGMDYLGSYVLSNKGSG